MPELPVASGSAWSPDEIEDFLSSYRAPLRLCANSAAGAPLLCSLWFAYQDGRLLCATQRKAKMASLLAADPRCAFEISTNEPPYFGVRGQGRATLRSEGAAELLGRLIDRYLGSRDSSLARWLLARAEDEVAIQVEPAWLTSWDYTSRMGG